MTIDIQICFNFLIKFIYKNAFYVRFLKKELQSNSVYKI